MNTGKAVDLARGAPKIQVNALGALSGEPLNWEEWEMVTSATLGQTVYADLLSTAPLPDPVSQRRNKELYNMLLKATQLGLSLHVMKGIEDENGHEAWQALKTWYGTGCC